MRTKNLRIILINVLIILVVVVIVWLYASSQMKAGKESATNTFVNTAYTMEKIVNSYLADSQRTCSSWANYLNDAPLSIEEAVEFVRVSKTAPEVTVHVIWKDTLEGYSTDAYPAGSDNYEVSYKELSDLVYDAIASSDNTVYITRKYNNPRNGDSVVAFCRQVELIDNGSPRMAVVLRILPVEYAKGIWTFPAIFEGEQTALMEQEGSFVIQPEVLEGTNFYEFIAENNPGTVDVEELQTYITENNSGSFYANNADGERMMFAFSHIQANSDWVTVSCITESELTTGSTDWTIPIMIILALGAVLVIDLLFFRELRKEDRRTQATLEEQLDTIRKQEGMLRDALGMAEDANAAKSNFLSNMSHDIRTPMNAIVGLTTMLAKDADNPEKVREHTKKIASSSQHLLSLINDVLDMSKIESGKTTLNITEINLAEIVEEIGTIMRPQFKAKEQTFDIRVTDLRNEHILGDKLRVNQILINLLSNAHKYTQCGGHIALKITQAAQDRKNYARYRFVVEDNGYGMSEDYMEILFDPFTREENSTTNRVQGTGLGLAITKSLVELMGGRISVDSRQNQGSTFTVDLEFRLQDMEIDQDFWIHHGITHVLTVDDEEDVCRNIEDAMAGTGVAMQCATSGRDAVELVEQEYGAGTGFDLILLDWQMPGMDGIETARRIRRIVPEHIPIMILTAYDWNEVEDEALAAGIDGFLPKPFFLTNFKQTIDRLLSQDGPLQEEDYSMMEGKNFLAVEDYALNAEILLEVLERYGATADLAHNGKEGVEMFEKSEPGQYDAILMDVQMPVMNGYEATREIRASSHPNAKSIVIIAMTANAFAEDVKDALDAGMNEHVAKPIDMDRLQQVLVREWKKQA